MPPPRVVVTARGPGKRAFTTPALAIAPSICAIKTKAPRAKGTAPTRHKPSVTCQIYVSGCYTTRSLFGTGKMVGSEECLGTYCRIEQTARNTEKDPCVDGQGKRKCKTDVQEDNGIWTLWQFCAFVARTGGRRVGHLSTGKREEQEHEGACKTSAFVGPLYWRPLCMHTNKFGSHCDKMVSRTGRHLGHEARRLRCQFLCC